MPVLARHRAPPLASQSTKLAHSPARPNSKQDDGAQRSIAEAVEGWYPSHTMTRHQTNLAAVSGGGKTSGLKPVRAHRNLTAEVVERLAAEIRSGRLKPGGRLPTEQELMSVLGVSRTVVREAVAALKADGLVTTRQGAGAFVSSDDSRVPFRIAPEGLATIDDVLDVMELRLAVEVEAAGLAAERVTPSSRRSVEAALEAIEPAIARGEGAVAEDFAFHLAIAKATGNAHFVQFLSFLGRHVIPRQSIRAAVSTPEETRAYLARIQKEHARIAQAIAAGDGSEARRAMRVHLTKSLERYRSLAAQGTKQP